jgi:hypothetical protein
VKINEAGIYGKYKLFECEGRYYAVSQRLKRNELESTISENKAIVAESEIELKRVLQEAEKWADTRGLYGLEEVNENRAPIKANSYNMDEDSDFDVSDPVLMKTDDGFFLVEKDDLLKNSKDKDYITQDDTGLKFVGAVSKGASPELIFEYKKFNIVEYDKIFYGIPMKIGQVHLHEVNPKTLKGVVYSDLLKDTMIAIDRSWGKPDEEDDDTKIALPKLIESRDNQNIVFYDEYYYLIPQNLGNIDLTIGSDRNLPSIFKAKELDEIYKALEKKTVPVKIDEDSKVSSEDENYGTFIEEYRDYKVVLFEQTYFCYPKGKEDIDFSNTDYFSLDYVFYDVSISAIKELINDETSKK